MRATDIIEKKRNGQALTDSEIKFLLKGYLQGDIPDYQMSAFLMAVCFNGLNTEELKAFTHEMIHSGEQIRFDDPEGFLLDKHSTGGVGDKTTIALAPLLASFDIHLTKLTGKGLAHTGGTIDKFESIIGFCFPQDQACLQEQLRETGVAIMGYSDSIVPLDKKLYALRDVTGTVGCIPLIASSIMSKKLAVESEAIMLDVKVGKGAFVKTIEEARELAQKMLEIGCSFGRKMIIHISNMEEPLGKAVGNSLELIEAMEVLHGKGPEAFRMLVIELAATALLMKGEVETMEKGKEKVVEMLSTELPLQKLKTLIKHCGGNEAVVDDYSLLPTANQMIEVKADHRGWVAGLDAEMIGKACMLLGAGRKHKDDVIDHSVGLILEKKTGDLVREGDTLAKVYYNDEEELQNTLQLVEKAYTYSEKRVNHPDLILETMVSMEDVVDMAR